MHKPKDYVMYVHRVHYISQVQSGTREGAMLFLSGHKELCLEYCYQKRAIVQGTTMV